MKARIADEVFPTVCRIIPFLPIRYPFLIVTFFGAIMVGLAVGDFDGDGVGEFIAFAVCERSCKVKAQKDPTKSEEW
jgi:hypothetical protein